MTSLLLGLVNIVNLLLLLVLTHHFLDLVCHGRILLTYCLYRALFVLYQIWISRSPESLSHHVSVCQGESRREGHRTLRADEYLVDRFIVEKVESNGSSPFGISSNILVMLCDNSCIVFVKSIDDLLRHEGGS